MLGLGFVDSDRMGIMGHSMFTPLIVSVPNNTMIVCAARVS